MNQKLAELSMKSQREGRIIYAFDWNRKTYFQIQGMKIKKISEKQYLAQQG